MRVAVGRVAVHAENLNTRYLFVAEHEREFVYQRFPVNRSDVPAEDIVEPPGQLFHLTVQCRQGVEEIPREIRAYNGCNFGDPPPIRDAEPCDAAEDSADQKE